MSLFCDLPFDQVLERGFVDFAIFKRSNKSGYRTLDAIVHWMELSREAAGTLAPTVEQRKDQ